jgi:hypothetical protein
MMRKKFESLGQVKSDLLDKKIDTLNHLELHNALFPLKIEERIQAFKLIFTDFQEKIKSRINTMENECETEQLQKDNLWFQQKLDKIDELINLYHNDTPLPFQKGKSYVVSEWDPCYMADTGGGSEYIESKKGKVIENSSFKNAYDIFVFGSRIFREDNSGIPYVLMKISYGEYRGLHVYLRSDKLLPPKKM